MKIFILVAQLVIAVGLSVSILLQAKGSGLGMTFGEAAESYRSKRGVEKLLYQATITLAVLFLVTSIANLLIH